LEVFGMYILLSLGVAGAREAELTALLWPVESGTYELAGVSEAHLLEGQP
jgi:hypothetical protein